MPTPRFYNTLTHQLETFTPIQPGKVAMYNCGPTVYDFAHIGNFKTFLFADVLRRFLELLGHDVHQVMNLTDVGHMTDDALADGGGEDKMAAAAKRLTQAKKSGQAHADHIDNPDDPYQVAEFYTRAFLDDARKLRLKVADEYPQNMPLATDHVKHMLELIGTLLEKNHAYIAPASGDGRAGPVYFRVQSFPAYGTLSGNTLDQLRGGAGGRIDATHQAGKQHPADFLLWKPDATHLMKWNPKALGVTGPAAELGEGYPGWHIECSAMARAVLGQDVIDIHTGGEDNIFPHHECEIAQSVAATGQKSFANLWMHSRHLMVEGKKMSKSKGNFFTVRQILEGDFTGRPVDPAVLRFELIKANYRSQMDFSRKGLMDSASAVKKLRSFQNRAWLGGARLIKDAWVTPGRIDPTGLEFDEQAITRFKSCLTDDLNTAGAIAVIFEFISKEPSNTDENAWAKAAQTLEYFNQVFAVIKDPRDILPKAYDTAFEAALGRNTAPQSVQRKCHEIDAARRAKDFATADTIRDQLQAAGYEVKTTNAGTVATKKLA